MANIAIFRINYKSDFILTLDSDAGWMTPFCIKFWTGAPIQAYFVGFDGTTYTHCTPVDGEPTKLRVQFDDHHLPIGDLKFQIAYHFTVADFPTSVEDEVLNQASVIIEVDDAPAQVMLDLNGETAPEIEFSLPAYANEAQRIANEQQRISNEEQRIANEEARIAAETVRQQNEEQRIEQETARVNEFARLKRESEQATTAANTAATLANEKAQLAADKAALAQAAATLANEKAQLAADKAALAQDAADLANAKAALAQQKAEYANEQGDYAKEQGIIAEEDHVRAEADHERAESDHAALENVPDSVPSTSPTDLSVNVEDVYLKNRSNNNPQAPRTLARLVTDSAKNRPLNESLTRLAEYQSLGFPAFSTSVDYAEGDPCFHDRRLYKAKAGGHSAGTWNAAHFEEFSVKEYTDAHVGIFDVSANNDGAFFASLQALLSDANLNTLIPAPFRRGGITITFIQGTAQSYDNKYVQFRLMAQNFTTNVTQWQGVDDEPTAGSDNLIKSKAVSTLQFDTNTVIGGPANLTIESGEYLSDGTPNDNTRRARTKGYIPPAKWYLKTIQGYRIQRVCYYEEDGTFYSEVAVGDMSYQNNNTQKYATITIRRNDNEHFSPSPNIIDTFKFTESITDSIATLQNDVSQNASDLTELNGIVTEHGTNITNLNNSVNTLNSKDSSIEIEINGIDSSAITFVRGGLDSSTGVQTNNNSLRADTVQYLENKPYKVVCIDTIRFLRVYKYSDLNGTFVGYEAIGSTGNTFSYNGQYYTKLEFVKLDGSKFTTQNPTGLISSIVNGGINKQLNGLSFWKGTQAQYDALGTYDNNTVYFIMES